MRVKPLGQLALIVAVGVAVGAAGQHFLQRTASPSEEKTLKWEHLEGEEGSDLQRAQTPNGWVVENSDGYLLHVPDPEHKWLETNEDN